MQSDNASISDKTLAVGCSRIPAIMTPAASALPLAMIQTPAASALPLTATPISRIFKNSDFGYHTITVERPELDAKGKAVKETKVKRKGLPKPDAKLRDSEDVPLGEDIETYFQREVIPHFPDAWIDNDKTKIGYEIPFNRHFYVFKPPRELAEIDAELKGVTDRIVKMIGELSQ